LRQLNRRANKQLKASNSTNQQLKSRLAELKEDKNCSDNLLNQKLALQKRNRCLYEIKARAKNKFCLNNLNRIKSSKLQSMIQKTEDEPGQLKMSALLIENQEDIFTEVGLRLDRQVKYYLRWIDQFQDRRRPFCDYVFQMIKAKIMESFSKEVEVR